MSYDEQEDKRSRVVVETPPASHNVVRTASEYPSAGNSSASVAIAVLVILAVAIIALLGLLFWSMQANSNNANLAAQQQPTPPTTIQQPAQQPPVIVQQPAPATQQAPIIVNPPAAAPTAGSNAPSALDDGVIQTEIDNKLQNDSTLSTLDVKATVTNRQVLLTGSVKTDQLKHQVEKAVRAIKGVRTIDNQISVTGP